MIANQIWQFCLTYDYTCNNNDNDNDDKHLLDEASYHYGDRGG